MIYGIQYAVFHDTDDTVFYFLQDLAFVPIQVLMVTLIINRVMNIMEKYKKIKKINVIISAFFIEAGTSILKSMTGFCQNRNELQNVLSEGVTKKNSNSLIREIKGRELEMYAEPERLQDLMTVLSKHGSYMLDMLGNDNLLEHDSFTDMLWAVFHVNDELQSRGEFKDFETSDIDHLSNDIRRAYSALVTEWIKYMGYLQEEYPFLHATAMRKNPFSEGK